MRKKAEKIPSSRAPHLRQALLFGELQESGRIVRDSNRRGRHWAAGGGAGDLYAPDIGLETSVGVRKEFEGAGYVLYQTDAFSWLKSAKANSIHAVVTDPPYGLLEYRPEQLRKLQMGRGGVWRIPPSFDGCVRRPLPRFTILSESDKEALAEFFRGFAGRLLRVLVPGGHVFVATNPLLSHLVCVPFIEAGFEKRGEIVRLVQTLRGGDRPKHAHREFPDVSVMPRSQWEPWVLFRKPCEGRVQDNLRQWKTGGLRRISGELPFGDVISSSPTPSSEREIANHPSLKPQRFLRKLVRAALPLAKGVILDPFMGSGSTIAAARSVGYQAIGLEINPEYFEMAMRVVPNLAAIEEPRKRLKDCAVYQRRDIVLRGGKPVPINGDESREE